MKVFLGIDVGAVSADLAVLDERLNLVAGDYARTEGDPIGAVRRIMGQLDPAVRRAEVLACGATGSGRYLAAALTGADRVVNEISAHARAAIQAVPDVRTVIEIGGQDSKIIIVERGAIVDFGLNTVCAAGTGSCLDHQAGRMGLTVDEFARLAASASRAERISGRCAVFAETDIIEKQQRGVERSALARGLCEALVRNYLSGPAGGKPIRAPVVFQGGVAANPAVRFAFERELGTEPTVPENHHLMGAIGSAILAAGPADHSGPSRFAGFELPAGRLNTASFICDQCPNACEILEISRDGVRISRWGGRCGRWNQE
jgi:predicted CoA-substrate-specific enzyme activase